LEEQWTERLQKHFEEFELSVGARLADLTSKVQRCSENLNNGALDKVARDTAKSLAAQREDLLTEHQRALTEASENWLGRFQDLRKNVDAADVLMKQSIGDLREVTAKQQQEVEETRSAVSRTEEGLCRLGLELREKGVWCMKVELREEFLAAFVASKAESRSQLQDFEASLEGQRRWLENRVRHLSERCQKAETESGEAKYRAERASPWAFPKHWPTSPTATAMPSGNGNQNQGPVQPLPPLGNPGNQLTS
jgi:hypothetical protein